MGEMMSYRPGNMGVAEGMSLVFFVTIVRAFLSTAINVIQETGGLAWIVLIVITSVTIIMLYLMFFVCEHYEGDLITVSEKLMGKAGGFFVALFFSGVFLLNAISIIRQFAENTLITTLPDMEFSFVILSYTVTAALIVYWGIEGIARYAYLFLPYAIGGVLLVLLMVSPEYNIHHFFPWEGMGLKKSIITSMMLGGTNVGIFLVFLLAPAFQDVRTIKEVTLLGLGLGFFFREAVVVAFLLTFGVAVGQEKVLPFFELARIVFLSRFIQRVETMFIIIWVIVGVLSIAINMYGGIYLISRLCNLPALQPIVPITAVSLMILAMLPPDLVTMIQLDGKILVAYMNIGLYGIPVVLFVLTLFQRKKAQSQCLDK